MKAFPLSPRPFDSSGLAAQLARDLREQVRTPTTLLKSMVHSATQHDIRRPEPRRPRLVPRPATPGETAAARARTATAARRSETLIEALTRDGIRRTGSPKS